MPPSQLEKHSPGARKDEKATLPLPARRGGGGRGQCRGRCVASEVATRNHWPGVRRQWQPAPLAARQVPSVALAHLNYVVGDKASELMVSTSPCLSGLMLVMMGITT